MERSKNPASCPNFAAGLGLLAWIVLVGQTGLSHAEDVVLCSNEVTLTAGQCDCYPKPAPPRYRPYPKRSKTPVPTPMPAPAPKTTPTPAESPSTSLPPNAIDGPYGLEDRYSIDPNQIDGVDLDGADAFNADAFGDAAATSLPSGAGAVAAASSPSTHMIGDYFGNGYVLGNFADSVMGQGITTAPIAGGDRRYKATDNLSPVPTDRVFFNYHHFHNAVTDIFGDRQNVDRFTFGIERTCLNGMVSFEIRVPFANGLDNVQDIFSTNTTTSEFGNIPLAIKARLAEHNGWTLTSGFVTILPTAEDATFDDGTTYAVFENNALHLQPYLGLSFATPCSRWFSTAYMAVDFDANGNGLVVDEGFSAPDPTFLGNYRDQTMLFLDWQIGYWCYQDYGHIDYLTGMASVLELHYSHALDDADVEPGILENPFGRVDILNLTAGLVFDFRSVSTLTIYGAAPLLEQEVVRDDEVLPFNFQSEFGAQWVYYY